MNEGRRAAVVHDAPDSISGRVQRCVCADASQYRTSDSMANTLLATTSECMTGMDLVFSEAGGVGKDVSFESQR